MSMMEVTPESLGYVESAEDCFVEVKSIEECFYGTFDLVIESSTERFESYQLELLNAESSTPALQQHLQQYYQLRQQSRPFRLQHIVKTANAAADPATNTSTTARFVEETDTYEGVWVLQPLVVGSSMAEITALITQGQGMVSLHAVYRRACAHLHAVTHNGVAIPMPLSDPSSDPHNMMNMMPATISVLQFVLESSAGAIFTVDTTFGVQVPLRGVPDFVFTYQELQRAQNAISPTTLRNEIISQLTGVLNTAEARPKLSTFMRTYARKLGQGNRADAFKILVILGDMWVNHCAPARLHDTRGDFVTFFRQIETAMKNLLADALKSQQHTAELNALLPQLQVALVNWAAIAGEWLGTTSPLTAAVDALLEKEKERVAAVAAATTTHDSVPPSPMSPQPVPQTPRTPTPYATKAPSTAAKSAPATPNLAAAPTTPVPEPVVTNTVASVATKAAAPVSAATASAVTETAPTPVTAVPETADEEEDESESSDSDEDEDEGEESDNAAEPEPEPEPPRVTSLTPTTSNTSAPKPRGIPIPAPPPVRTLPEPTPVHVSSIPISAAAVTVLPPPVAPMEPTSAVATQDGDLEAPRAKRAKTTEVASADQEATHEVEQPPPPAPQPDAAVDVALLDAAQAQTQLHEFPTDVNNLDQAMLAAELARQLQGISALVASSSFVDAHGDGEGTTQHHDDDGSAEEDADATQRAVRFNAKQIRYLRQKYLVQQQKLWIEQRVATLQKQISDGTYPFPRVYHKYTEEELAAMDKDAAAVVGEGEGEGEGEGAGDGEDAHNGEAEAGTGRPTKVTKTRTPRAKKAGRGGRGGGRGSRGGARGSRGRGRGRGRGSGRGRGGSYGYSGYGEDEEEEIVVSLEDSVDEDEEIILLSDDDSDDNNVNGDADVDDAGAGADGDDDNSGERSAGGTNAAPPRARQLPRRQVRGMIVASPEGDQGVIGASNTGARAAVPTTAPMATGVPAPAPPKRPRGRPRRTPAPDAQPPLPAGEAIPQPSPSTETIVIPQVVLPAAAKRPTVKRTGKATARAKRTGVDTHDEEHVATHNGIEADAATESKRRARGKRAAAATNTQPMDVDAPTANMEEEKEGEDTETHAASTTRATRGKKRKAPTAHTADQDDMDVDVVQEVDVEGF